MDWIIISAILIAIALLVGKIIRYHRTDWDDWDDDQTKSEIRKWLDEQEEYKLLRKQAD